MTSWNQWKQWASILALTLGIAATAFGQAGVAGDPVLKTADLIVYESGAGNGLVATGSGGFNVDLMAAADGVGATTNNSGMEFGATGGTQLGLLQGCSDGNVLKWTESTSVWSCAADAGSNPLSIAPTCEALTIATGAVTFTGAANTITCHTIETESAAATDDLTSVTCTAGSWHLISPINAARTVVVVDGAGVQVQADFSMDNTEDRMLLACDAANTVTEISRANNGA